MKNVEVLSAQEYDFYSYQIEKITNDIEYTIILRNLNRSPYGVCSIFTYKNVGATIESPLLNWHNLFFCSNYYGPAPHPGYMNCAVQNGVKTAATAYVSYEEYPKLLQTLPDNCRAIPYDTSEEHMTMAYVYRNCMLRDLFNFEEIKHLYVLHGISNINWDYVEDRFSKSLEFFADSNRCGFNIQQGVKGKEDLIINGVLLGYPIESTVAYMKKTYNTFGDGPVDQTVKDHFKNSVDPIDWHGKRWYKSNGIIYCDGQQEEIYFE